MKNWAILGCGNIANDFARDITRMGGKIYSVANRTYEKALAFAEKYNIEKVYENIDDLFVDEKVDIVYIATTHNKHIEYIIKALENGKHVLCEKAITLNSDELNKAVVHADEKKLILAEAMTIYNMPLYTELEKIINSGRLGEFRQFQRIRYDKSFLQYGLSRWRVTRYRCLCTLTCENVYEYKKCRNQFSSEICTYWSRRAVKHYN